MSHRHGPSRDRYVKAVPARPAGPGPPEASLNGQPDRRRDSETLEPPVHLGLARGWRPQSPGSDGRVGWGPGPAGRGVSITPAYNPESYSGGNTADDNRLGLRVAGGKFLWQVERCARASERSLSPSLPPPPPLSLSVRARVHTCVRARVRVYARSVRARVRGRVRVCAHVTERAFVCVCACARARARVRACVPRFACVRACVRGPCLSGRTRRERERERGRERERAFASFFNAPLPHTNLCSTVRARARVFKPEPGPGAGGASVRFVTAAARAT